MIYASKPGEILKTGETLAAGSVSHDDRMDWYEFTDEKIKKDAGCVAIVCMKYGVSDSGNGHSILKTKNYGELVNLCENEPFREQPVAAVPFFTGFLVKEDMLVTAGHCVDGVNVADLRIVFGFRMSAPFTPVTKIPNDNIYEGTEIIDCGGWRDGSDWALVKLDRKVGNLETAVISQGAVSCRQAVHVIGHPMGLPLKYTAGASVCDNSSKFFFTANLNIYGGNSGSPVFNSDTHEVIGVVVRGYNRYFQYVGNGWLSIPPSNRMDNGGAHCTRVCEFIDVIRD